MNSNALAEHSIEAPYPSMKMAQQALTALEWAGVEADSVSLAGPGANEGLAETDTSTRDSNILKHVAKRATVGVIIGTILGAIAGAIGGWLMAIAMDSGAGWTVPVGILIGAVIGWHAGGIVGGETALSVNPARELEHEPEADGPTVVRVHVPDKSIADRAAAVLQAKEPMTLRRFNSSGGPE